MTDIKKYPYPLICTVVSYRIFMWFWENRSGRLLSFCHQRVLQYSRDIATMLLTIYFNTMYRASCIILYYDQQMHNYFTNYPTPTCFDIIVSSSGSL